MTGGIYAGCPTSNQLRFQPEGIALPLDSVKKPVLAQALEVPFTAVPLPKKAPAETLGGLAELAPEAAAHGAHEAEGVRLDAACTTADMPAEAPTMGELDIAGAAGVEGDAVTVMVILTVSVTTWPAAQPEAPPAKF